MLASVCINLATGVPLLPPLLFPGGGGLTTEVVFSGSSKRWGIVGWQVGSLVV